VIQTLVFLGGCMGMCVFMMITENFGRKLSLQMCLGIMLIGLTIVISSRNLAMVGVGIFVIIFGTETSYQFVFCFCS
jgi:hypothetical protein